MSDVPTELKYAESHEWVRDDGEGVYCVGITEYAQESLNDMVFVELPAPGRKVSAGDVCAQAESVKTVSDIYAPISGEIIETNEALEASPELINFSPYEDGWLFKIQVSNEAEFEALLDAEEYGSTLK